MRLRSGVPEAVGLFIFLIRICGLLGSSGTANIGLGVRAEAVAKGVVTGDGIPDADCPVSVDRGSMNADTLTGEGFGADGDFTV